MKDQMIYFVLPVYNEENNIRPLIQDIRSKIKDVDYRIIAVNDGSSDNSLSILKELKKDDIIIESSVINMNVGAVFSSGIGRVILESKNDNDMMIIMESDQTSELEFIPDMIKEVNNGSDIVIASRYKEGGRYENFPFLRLVFSYFANQMMRSYFPIKDVLDYTIFFRAYRLGIIKKVMKYFGNYGFIQSKGFVANAEFLVKASFFTNNIREIPFIYNYAKKKGASKINVLRTINEYFVLISYLKRIEKKISVWKKVNNIEGILS